MLIIQLCCVAILALYLVLRLRRAPDRGAVLRRLVLLALASWLGEDSMIRLHHFYQYSPGWSLFVDQVPLLIICIWPAVVDSAWQLARHLSGEDRGPRLVLLGFLLVLADASLIEPIAIACGLWSWNAPGFFGVPPVGVLGWAVFAACCIAIGDRRPALLSLLVPATVTHAVLIAVWWGLLRWVSTPLPSVIAVGAAWVALLPAAALSFQRRLRRRVPIADLWLRLPAALFFFALLPGGGAALLAYTLAFVPLYLSLMDL